MTDRQQVSEEAVFSVTDRWGDLIVLSKEDWARIVSKRPAVQPYAEETRLTLKEPNAVFTGRYADSKVFYRRDLLDHPFRGCYVAVVVRYSTVPATIRTVYFPFNMQAKLGEVLHMQFRPRE